MLTLLLLLLFSTPASAFPNYAVLYKSTFSYLPSCTLCHDQDSWEPNDFGKQFLKGGRTLKAFQSIKDLDADGDGAANLAEILARSNAADPRSRPDRPGDWLKSALIKSPQKLLKQAFPGASRFEVKEIRLDDPKLPDESRFSVVFPAADGAQVLGAGAYVSVDLPGREGHPTLLFVAGDKAGVLRFLKIFEYDGTKSLSGAKVWAHLVGKDPDAILKDTAVKGPAAEIAAFKQTIARGLTVVKKSLE